MAHIDWITATIPYGEFDILDLPNIKAFATAKATYPPPRYETAFYTEGGALIASPSLKNARQKVLFQMTGDSCEMFRELGVPDTKLLYWLMREKKARFPRFDVAFDTDSLFAVPDHLLWAWQDKRVKTRISAPPRTVSEDEHGVTHYFGAASSDRQLRTYDKAAELGLLSEALTRVELQNRGDMAQHLVGEIVRNNELDWTSAAAVKGLIDFPECEWFQKLMQSGGVKLTPLGRKETDWKKYIRDIIEPSYLRHWRDDENGDRLFTETSLKRMQEKMKELREDMGRKKS